MSPHFTPAPHTGPCMALCCCRCEWSGAWTKSRWRLLRLQRERNGQVGPIAAKLSPPLNPRVAPPERSCQHGCIMPVRTRTRPRWCGKGPSTSRCILFPFPFTRCTPAPLCIPPAPQQQRFDAWLLNMKADEMGKILKMKTAEAQAYTASERAEQYKRLRGGALLVSSLTEVRALNRALMRDC